MMLLFKELKESLLKQLKDLIKCNSLHGNLDCERNV